MATETSSIDDFLMTGKTASQPEAPEHQFVDDNEMIDDSAPEPQSDTQPEYEPQDYEGEQDGQNDLSDEPTDGESLDEYGNEKPKPRVYTEEEVNDRINKAVRDRLSRMKSNDQAMPTQQQVQQAQQGFEYNPDSDQGWQQQLETFIEQTLTKVSQKHATRQQQEREHQAQTEFQDKFTQGMERFNDFREVVSSQPITDPMTYALRGMKDPAAFVYAASKRHPQELQRISQIGDPYAQMVEMGKLEERMRKTAPSKSNAPRPVQRLKEDAGMPQAKKKNDGNDSIEDLIARSDAKRQAQLNARRGGRR